MAADNPITQAFYEQHGIDCHAVPVDELAKAAGAIGCLSGVIERERIRGNSMPIIRGLLCHLDGVFSSCGVT